MIVKQKIDLSEGIQIGEETVLPGTDAVIRINAGKLPSDNRINVFAHVYNSGVPGPVILIMGGVHGDEINGIEIVRRSIEFNHFKNLHSGAVIAIPLLNVYGFINFSRDVSDGKDVNRSFPGHMNGSLASRVARIITLKILPLVDFAIDFHTGGAARYNYPQIRYVASDDRAAQMGDVFGTKFMVESPLIMHSFRKSAHDMGVSAIVFEGGESVRFDALSIEYGLQGILNVLSFLKIKNRDIVLPERRYLIEKNSWIRSSMAGLFLWYKQSGELIKKGEILGIISDPFGMKSLEIISKVEGVMIGHNNASVVNLGDALFNVGTHYKILEKGNNTGF